MTNILRRAAVALLLASAFAPVALGQASLETMSLANNLGTVIAGEKVCGFTYNQQAIAAFISENVPADDLDFAPMLAMSVTGQEFSAGGLSESARTAQCAAIAQSARHYGFME